MSPTHGIYNHYIECSDVDRLHVPAILLIAGKNKSQCLSRVHPIPNLLNIERIISGLFTFSQTSDFIKSKGKEGWAPGS